LRKLCETATCQICDMEDETGFHAVVRCTKAVALRQEMRAYCTLPEEEQFQRAGPDWLLLLLGSLSKEIGAQILMLFWRMWQLRNDIIHGEGTCLIVVSSKFLVRYWD
jgi:hypothetical protein